MATITGTQQRNILNGTSAIDIIRGLGGNDDLFGLAGNDRLFGGIGNDRQLGGAGNDQLLGEAGNDSLDGGLGTDTMRGGRGNDIYIVNVSADVAIELAGEGADLVKAGASFTLGANIENLTLTGALSINGTGNAVANVIAGNNRSNILIGGGGNDVISGAGGQDTLLGGNGDDRLLPGPGNRVPDAIHGGAGDDTVDYSDAAASVFIDLSNLFGDEQSSASGDVFSGIENVIGSRFNDNLNSALGGPFHLAAGGPGNDVITCTAATYDRVRGDDGFDRLVGSTGNADDFWLQYDRGMDQVLNFRPTDGDHLFISKTEFNLATAAGNFINPAELAVGPFQNGPDNSVRLIFDTQTHILWAFKGTGQDVLPMPIALLRDIGSFSNTDIFVF